MNPQHDESTATTTDEPKIPTDKLDEQLRQCSKVVSHALLARAILHLQANNNDQALADLNDAVLADKDNKEATTLQKVLANSETESTPTPELPQLTDQCFRFEVGYQINPSFRSGVPMDRVLRTECKTGHAMYDAIRTACQMGGFDPSVSNSPALYYDKNVGYISDYDWEYVSVAQVHTVREEILRIPVNFEHFERHDIWESYPYGPQFPLLNHKMDGFPRGRWAYPFQWLDEPDSNQQDPFRLMRELEVILENIVNATQIALETDAETSGTSLLEICNILELLPRQDDQSMAGRQREKCNQTVAQLSKSRLEEMQDGVRTATEAFLKSHPDIDPKIHWWILEDAEGFANAFLRERLFQKVPEIAMTCLNTIYPDNP